MADDAPFWKTKKLEQMNDAEWESLCDGCAKCCLVKLEDEDTAELFYTGVHCKLLNAGTCQCSDYPNRKKHVPDCVKVTAKNIMTLEWMPHTCAYRLVAEGKDLFDWHHLVCGDRWEVHRRGVSAMGKTVSEEELEDEADALDHIIKWYHKPPRPRRTPAAPKRGTSKARSAPSRTTTPKPPSPKPPSPKPGGGRK